MLTREMGQYRFTEERIETLDPIHLLGHFETPRRGPEDREALRRALLRVWKQDPRRMARFDKDGDGSISPEEWEHARQEADRLAEQSERDMSRAPVMPHVRETGDPRHPFFISTFTEAELIAHFGWQALGYTLGFLALASLFGVMVTSRMAG